ncbi:MAG: ethanolamine ammonia-lyase subunit EutC [Tissierellia bacterium]|nr:ethanolamine ammonia-lyase subunit EutC [Tissierellia bacterium]
MISQADLKDIIVKVMEEMEKEIQEPLYEANKEDSRSNEKVVIDNVPDEELRDITQEKMKDVFCVPNPVNKEEYLKLKSKTAARLGVWRAGTRAKTENLLRFRADHAVAQDAVFSDVSEEFIEELGLKSYETKCEDKDMFLTRPDLGRKFDDKTLEQIKADCENNPQVQVYISDGLSSTAIEANVKDTLPAILDGLKGSGVKVGTPFFVKYGRVGAEDEIAKVLNADVTCVLIGERPGLATGESMSAYMVYKGYPGIPEAKRTVVSNIHKDGTPAAEAGAHIADILKKILEAKASGVDLKL